MAIIFEEIIKYFKLLEVEAQEEKKETSKWTRKLSFSNCEEEPPPPPPPQQQQQQQEEEECEEERKRSSFLVRRIMCMYNGAKHGLRDGSLLGVFFGGGYGIVQHIDKTYFHPEKKDDDGEKKSQNEDTNSTTNDTVIFVSACNSAISLGVLCAVYCATKALVHCSN